MLGQNCSHTWYLVKTEASCSSKYQVLCLTTHRVPALVVFSNGEKWNKIDLGSAAAVPLCSSSIIIPGQWLDEFTLCSHTDMQYRTKPWAARYNTWLLIKLTPTGVVFSCFSTGLSSDTWCIQGEAVGDLEHGTEHSGIPMAPADARPLSITRLPAPSNSPAPLEPGTSTTLLTSDHRCQITVVLSAAP